MMSLFKRKIVESNCAHSWHLADYETRYFNAGTSVDVEDYFILRCTHCGNKRSVDEFEFYKLQRYGLLSGGANE